MTHRNAFVLALFLVLANTAGVGAALSAPSAAIMPPAPTQGGAAFSPPHLDYGLDTGFDFEFDQLVVEVNLSVNEATTFVVEGYLHDANFTLFLYSFSLVSGFGNRVARLIYDGPAVNASGVDGPYDVDLFLSRDDTLEVVATDLHVTKPYSHLEFEPPAAVTTPPHTEFGRDTDGDGQFNFLTIDVHLTVLASGTYILGGQLFDITGGLNMFAFNVSALNPGPATARLSFSGPRIKAAGFNGPYGVILTLADYFSSIIQDSEIYVTGAYDHLVFDDRPVVDSPIADVAPTIDGAIEAGEWIDAHVEDLSRVPGNLLPGFLYVKHDYQNLYVAYDAVGDTSANGDDVASIAFDTGNDRLLSDGGEDQFLEVGSGVHLVYSAQRGGWIVEDSPYDPALPDHQNLTSARGFFDPVSTARFHRNYEFAVPLALLGVAPGDTIGFYGGSVIAPGIGDIGTFTFSFWPDNERGLRSLDSFAELYITPDLVSPILSVLTPAPGESFRGADLLVEWTASDEGFGLDRIEVSLDGGTPIRLAANATSHVFEGVAEGTHTVRVVAYDRAGNAAVVSVQVVADRTPPSTAVTSPGDGGIVTSSTVRIAWTASDSATGIERIEVVIDGGPPQVLAGNATELSVAGLSDGVHNVTITTYDGAGNSASDSATFRVDTAVLSPTGPYGIIPLVSIAAAIAAGGILLFLIVRRRRRPPTVSPAPPPPEMPAPPPAPPAPPTVPEVPPPPPPQPPPTLP